MRIAYVCADRGVPVFGRKGNSIHVQEVVRSLMSNGASVELFAARLGGHPPRGLESVLVHRLPRGSHGEAVDKEQSSLKANDDLRSALRTTGPFDLVYERHSLWSYAGMEYARECGIPGLLEVNAPLIEEQRRYRRLVLEADAERAVARTFAAASALLGVSDDVAGYLNRHPEARGRVHVVPNGVDPSRFPPNLEPALPEERGTFTVGFVGTLKPWHGVQSLIEAFADLHPIDPRVRLLIVGDGPLRHDLEAVAAARGVDHATVFRGAVAPTQIPALLASMDVAVAPYPALDEFYFSPLKIFEYMAAGRAIVAAAIGQINHLIIDGVTGLLYRPGDTRGLTAALNRLKADPALGRRLGRAARRVAERDYTWHSVIRRIHELAEAHSPRREVRPSGR
ncbi:MAG: glycosyltransferase family 4 protein [Planctomycetota bacterium]|jgi:glycosyltransferase involved in cell wall biosynthesis